jgi:broad specificity phosphatase PhoE
MTATPSRPGAPKAGAIVLARHGEPVLSRKIKLNAAGYRDFWARYEVGGIRADRPPPDALRAAVEGGGTLVCSTRLRAIESAAMLTNGRDVPRHEVLIEAPLPPPPLPGWVRLSPSTWGFLARVCWWYLGHHEGQETRAQAEARAEQAADLVVEAAGSGDVVVLAHGFFNHLIGRALKRRGWRLSMSEGYKYWSMRRFERV